MVNMFENHFSVLSGFLKPPQCLLQPKGCQGLRGCQRHWDKEDTQGQCCSQSESERWGQATGLRPASPTEKTAPVWRKAFLFVKEGEEEAVPARTECSAPLPAVPAVSQRTPVPSPAHRVRGVHRGSPCSPHNTLSLTPSSPSCPHGSTWMLPPGRLLLPPGPSPSPNPPLTSPFLKQEH